MSHPTTNPPDPDALIVRMDAGEVITLVHPRHEHVLRVYAARRPDGYRILVITGDPHGVSAIPEIAVRPLGGGEVAAWLRTDIADGWHPAENDPEPEPAGTTSCQTCGQPVELVEHPDRPQSGWRHSSGQNPEHGWHPAAPDWTGGA